MLPITLITDFLNVPVNHHSVTVNQHTPYKDAENKPAKWKSAIIHFIIQFIHVSLCQISSFKTKLKKLYIKMSMLCFI